MTCDETAEAIPRKSFDSPYPGLATTSVRGFETAWPKKRQPSLQLPTISGSLERRKRGISASRFILTSFDGKLRLSGQLRVVRAFFPPRRTFVRNLFIFAVGVVVLREIAEVDLNAPPPPSP